MELLARMVTVLPGEQLQTIFQSLFTAVTCSTGILRITYMLYRCHASRSWYQDVTGMLMGTCLESMLSPNLGNQGRLPAGGDGSARIWKRKRR